MTSAEIYGSLGRALAQLDDPSFAAAEGFFGGRKQARLLRLAHARASKLDQGSVMDLGRLLADNVSPRSRISGLYADMLASIRG